MPFSFYVVFNVCIDALKESVFNDIPLYNVRASMHLQKILPTCFQGKEHFVVCPDF